MAEIENTPAPPEPTYSAHIYVGDGVAHLANVPPTNLSRAECEAHGWSAEWLGGARPPLYKAVAELPPEKPADGAPEPKTPPEKPPVDSVPPTPKPPPPATVKEDASNGRK